MYLFKQLFSELSGFKSITEAINKKISPVSVTGLSHIHRANLIYALSGNKINLVITGSEAEAKKLCDDINMMSGTETAVLFPSKELVLTPVDSSNHEYEHMRIAALSKAIQESMRSHMQQASKPLMQPVIPGRTLIASRKRTFCRSGNRPYRFLHRTFKKRLSALRKSRGSFTVFSQRLYP